MKKVLVGLTMILLVALGALGQTSSCLYCDCSSDENWLGAITDIKVTSWDAQGRAAGVDLFLELRPGWNGKDKNGCCNEIFPKVVQSCVEFEIVGYYFGSDLTGWGWDFDNNLVIEAWERMQYNETYFPEWDFLSNGNLQVVIHGIPLMNGLLRGNVYLLTDHGEINYFIPRLMKWCNKYAGPSGYGGSLIEVKFW